jgi:hypothetical protein
MMRLSDELYEKMAAVIKQFSDEMLRDLSLGREPQTTMIFNDPFTGVRLQLSTLTSDEQDFGIKLNDALEAIDEG